MIIFKDRGDVHLMKDPYEDIKFETRRALIKDKNGKIIFDEQVEFPDYFSDEAVNIVSSKYLCNEAKRKENSLKQMIDRVSETISEWGLKDSYFKDEEEKQNFENALKYYQVHQYFAFNSPVYFNVGLHEKPQTSACFILEIEDDMESIMDSVKMESLIFKGGSGSGMNMSPLRSSKERVRGGGFASGPCSFWKIGDTAAGVIKSGGTLRRSAKLVCLDVSHPDCMKFIYCKELEEKKMKALIDAGIEPEEGYEMSDSVFYQNTNISIVAPDSFMNAVEDDKSWWTRFVLDGEKCEKFNAASQLKEFAELAWRTGDPGLQFSDNINRWNTCANSGRIMSSNPCGEFVFLNNSSCNLASVNLLKFFSIDDQGNIKFDMELFKNVVRTIIIAQDILVDRSSFPSRKITNNTHNFRPLGLGYSNLGALLMWLGLPYDSEESRNITSLLTSLLTGCAFEASNELADKLQSFQKFEENKESYYKVLLQHDQHVRRKLEQVSAAFNTKSNVVGKLATDAELVWDRVVELVTNQHQFRNAQVTLLAPTGTISFMMDCVTKGIEPEYSLISYKTLSGSGGATIKMVNAIVKESLKNLGYSKNDIEKLCDELHSLGHFEKSSILKKEHLPIFDTAVSPDNGERCIDYMGHVRMTAAAQPFLSGAISKTINMHNNATVEDIYNLFMFAWKEGLKGITIYRDGSKTFQPLNKSQRKDDVKTNTPHEASRRKLSSDRPGTIHKFSIGSTEGYLMAGHYDDGSLGEVFLTVAKQGSTLSGLLDSLAIMISTNLQYGVPLKDIISKLMYSKFDPSGITANKDIRFSTSIVDYIARYLGLKYLSNKDKLDLGLIKPGEENTETKPIKEITMKPKYEDSAPSCEVCGGIMQRLGTCYNCNNCGSNTGSCG